MCCLLFVVSLFVVCASLCAVRCLLSVVCCLLFVSAVFIVCCLMIVDWFCCLLLGVSLRCLLCVCCVVLFLCFLRVLVCVFVCDAVPMCSFVLFVCRFGRRWLCVVYWLLGVCSLLRVVGWLVGWVVCLFVCLRVCLLAVCLLSVVCYV